MKKEKMFVKNKVNKNNNNDDDDYVGNFTSESNQTLSTFFQFFKGI